MQRVGVVAAAALLAVGLGRGAAAQVLDIAPDGAVTRLSGPAVYSDPATPPEPILSEAAKARISAPSAPVQSQASLADQMRSAAEHNGLSPRVVEAVAWRESRFNPRAVSPKGAVGVMQLMPGTARALGVDPRDSGANLEGGASYLASLLKTYNGDLTLALAAYNAGPEAVQRYAGVPPFPETRAFVDAILDRLADTVALGSAR